MTLAENVAIRESHVRIALGVLAMFGTGILVAYTQAAWWAIAALLAAIVLLVSGTLRVCPLYSLFGFSTSQS
ncbi:MAG: YgaP-like transmembrane domain [Candidatus Thermoplasmatota archaeon]